MPSTLQTRPRGPLAALAVTLLLFGGCARPVPFDNCTFSPVGLSADLPPEDFRVAVLSVPPSRPADEPRIEIDVRPVDGEPRRYRLDLTRLEDDPDRVTWGTGRVVDYWHRYALTETAYADYRDYRAQVAAPAGGLAEIEWTAWLARPPLMPAGPAVSEIRVRTNDATGYDAICRP